MRPVPSTQPQIRLDQTVGIVCPCGGQIFSEGLYLRKVSRFLTQQPKDGIQPIPVLYCIKCQEVIPELDPLKGVEEETA